MKKRIYISLAVFLIVAICQFPMLCSAGIRNHPVIVIMPFGCNVDISPDLALTDVGVAREIAHYSLVNSGYFDVVEMSFVDELADELVFSATGRLSTNSAREVARKLGADYVVIGNLNALSSRENTTEVAGIGGDAAIIYAKISMRIIDAATGGIMLSGNGSGRATNTLGYASNRMIYIGTEGFDLGQVYDAIQKATIDAVNGKKGLLSDFKVADKRKG